MRVTWLLSSLLALAGAVPASAADIATIDCVGQELPVSAHDDIVASSTAFATGDNRSNIASASRKAMRDAAARCAARHGWSASAAEIASGYAMFDIVYGVLVGLAEERGIDVAKITQAIAALPEPDRADYAVQRRVEAISAQFLRLLEDAGVSSEDRARQHILLGFLAALTMREQALKAFRSA